MLRLYVWLRDLCRREGGQDLVEYALIAALAGSLIVAVMVGTLSGAFGNWATDISSCVSDPESAACPWS